VALLLTADRLRRTISALTDAHGVTAQQYNVLRILRGSKIEGLATLEIAARMIEQTPGITRLLDRLESRELVRRERCSSDRRQILCWITGKGLRLLEELDQPVDRADKRALRMLSTGEMTALLRILKKVRQGISN